jgi:HEPN domain-containing protein
MTQPLDQSIIELLHASRDDERTIRLDVPDRTFGFHAQQAVEKLLKALIGGHGQRYACTHNIEILRDHAMSLGEQIPARVDLIVALTDFAGVWRYEEPDAITAERKAELRSTCKKLHEFVVERLSVLRPGVDWAAV